jgi:hypothetical protein
MSEENDQIVAVSYDPLIEGYSSKVGLYLRTRCGDFLFSKSDAKSLVGGVDGPIRLLPEPILVPDHNFTVGIALQPHLVETLEPILADCEFNPDQVTRIVLSEPEGSVWVFADKTLFELFKQKTFKAAGTSLRDPDLINDLFPLFGKEPALLGAYKASKMFKDLF